MEQLSKGERNRVKREITSDRHKLQKLEKQQRRTIANLAIATLAMIMSGMEMDEITKEIHKTRDDYTAEQREKAVKHCIELMETFETGEKIVL